MSSSIVSIDHVVKDMYPAPGTRIKQWVVDMRREYAWERETCPKVEVGQHNDNTGIECSNSRSTVPWSYLDHHCCYVCGELYEGTATRDEVVTWLALKAQRPAIEQDRTKLSDEIQPDVHLEAHPSLAVFKRKAKR